MVYNKKEYELRKKKLRKINIKSLNISVDFINNKGYLYEDGILIGDYSFEINKKSKNLFISDFGILGPYQGKGYGSYLARSIIILAKLYHLKTISLTDGSSLEGFWQRLGFKENKRIKNGTLRLEVDK